VTLVDVIRDCIPVLPEPAVNISGGIDSTIILHHLREKFKGKIRTYTVGFPSMETEFTEARRVSEHYDTEHKEIQIENLLSVYPELLKRLDRPRWNLWPWFLAIKQSEAGVKNVYIGEGGDEHFGGYWYKPHKSYVEHWSSLFEWCLPAYQQIYNMCGVNLVVPFHPNNLSIQHTLPYYDYSQEKSLIKKLYKNILPDFVLDRKKLNGRFSYWVIWNKELKQYFPECNPHTEADIMQLLNLWTIKEWLKCHEEAQGLFYTKYEPPKWSNSERPEYKSDLNSS